ncbi:MAG TPA: DEAD/DEAH box helicase [Gammaproteobacteria bacterium]|nr:DEAD/DEAH box helicase [Gammaproteobacteria bacterium]
MKHLRRGDISSNVSSSYYTRGKRYFEQGRVVTLQVEEEDDSSAVLSATVQGRGRNIYQQRIQIKWLDHDYVDIHGICSCPVHFNCKHMVAAVLAYQRDFFSAPARSGVAGSDCLAWLDEFARASDEQRQEQPGQQFLLYILQPSARPGRLKVEFQVSRRLKKGGFGKGRTVRLNNIVDSYYPPGKYLQPVDLEIGKLLDISSENSWYETVIEGDAGFVALSKMIQTGRCHWRHIDAPPVQAGEERSLELGWRRDERDNATLEVKVAGGGEPLLTTPPLYLEEGESATIGPLTGVPYSRPQLAKLLQQPTIPAERVAEFSARLLQKLPATPLPPPRQMEMIEVAGQPPRPALLLSGEMSDEGHRYHLLRLRFLYQGHETRALPLTEVQNIVAGDKLVRVWRDAPAEGAAIRRLQELGFEARESREGDDLLFLSMAERSLMDAAARWHRFLTTTIPQLQAEGWQVETDDSFQMQFHQNSEWEVEVDDDHDWFDLRFDVEIGGRRQPLLPLIAQVLDSYEPDQLPETLTLPVAESEYLAVPSAQIRPVLDILYELYDRDTLDGNGALRLSRFDAGRLAELEQNSATDLHWRGGSALRKLGRKLNGFQGIRSLKPPRGLRATLREYQQQGLNWLQFLREYGFGGILADDMGLGKTVQTLAHLLLEKQRGRMDKPCLIIAPTSLMSNWRREAEQFTPRLKVLILQGPERHQRFDEMDRYDLLLSTYPLLARDEERLLARDYHYLVLDEAQTIKNPRAKAAQVVRRIQARHRLCLTGTPMENHLGELWALFDFLMPGFLGDARQFKQLFRTPIEKQGDEERRVRLARRVAPFMLRRTKAEVVRELPEKSEIIRTVSLESRQAALYESIRIAMEKKVRSAIAAKGLARSHITILDALLKLRQTCCDPGLLSLKQARNVKESAKLELLMQMLPEMVEEGRRILLFSQFTKMLGIIEKSLDGAGIRYSKLTGQTRKRDEAIERFRSGAAEVFLISLKAGGVGLNLTEADTVIHYDPWWNPAAENQATDRAYRIGQDKAVFVYKLITENTVEEKILAMQAKKQALADGVYSPGEQKEQVKLTADDLRELFAPL